MDRLAGVVWPTFSVNLGRTPHPRGLGSLSIDAFHEFDKRLFEKKLLPCSVRLFSYGPHHGKTLIMGLVRELDILRDGGASR